MTNSEPTVFVVDDDPAVRQTLRRLIATVNLAVETYADAREFLDVYDPDRPGCFLLDLGMPGMSALDLLKKLASSSPCLPTIMVTGHGEVAPVVAAMKAGAVDVLEKPFHDQVLLNCVQEAIALDARRRQGLIKKREVAACYSLLTPRQREVMEMVVAGKPNKVIAVKMHISQKTVEAHRGQVMKKMCAQSVPDLVRFAGMVALAPAVDRARPHTCSFGQNDANGRRKETQFGMEQRRIRSPAIETTRRPLTGWAVGQRLA